MRICGIELKSNSAVISIIEIINGNIEYIDVKEKKMILKDDEDIKSVNDFFNSFKDFIQYYKIEKIALKKRAKKGNFAGGAVTFKIEGIIQLNGLCNVELISAQTISSYEKKNNIEYPSGLNKYQVQAYLSSLCTL